MKPADVKDNKYIDSGKETNNKDPKFKIGDRVRIWKYKNIFAKWYTPNWSEELFVIEKVWKYIKIYEIFVLWIYVINDLYSEEVVGLLRRNNCKKQIKQSLGEKK